MRKHKHLKGNKFALGNLPNKTSFKRGNIPWNKGMKGIHFSPDTEFKSGHRPASFCSQLGVIRVRTAYHHGGKQYKYIKLAHPNIWKLYAQHQWELVFGPLIRGDVVHHINGNTLDDKIDNLIALPREVHPSIHSRWGLKFLSQERLNFYKNRYEANGFKAGILCDG